VRWPRKRFRRRKVSYVIIDSFQINGDDDGIIAVFESPEEAISAGYRRVVLE